MMLLFAYEALALCVAPYLHLELDGAPDCLVVESYGAGLPTGHRMLVFDNACGEPIELVAHGDCEGCAFETTVAHEAVYEVEIVEYEQVEHRFTVQIQGETISDTLQVVAIGPDQSSGECNDTPGPCAHGAAFSWWSWMRR